MREIETIKKIFAAINRGDASAILPYLDPGIERTEPASFPTPGTYRGPAEVCAHIARGRATWAEGTCEPEEIIPAGDKFVALLHVHVRLHGRQDWIDGRFADGFVFRAGKVVRMITFAEREEALAWAGIG